MVWVGFFFGSGRFQWWILSTTVMKLQSSMNGGEVFFD